MNLLHKIIAAGIAATSLTTGFAQDPLPATAAVEATAPNPLAPGDQMLDLTDSVKLVRVMEYRYLPSQRDPFISHEIISPFVTEEEIAQEIQEETKLPSQEEVQLFLEKYIRVYGISTGDTGGGYALAAIATPASEKSEAGFRERILKPGEVIKIPLDEEALAKFGEAFLFWNWTQTTQPSISLVTTQILERHLNIPTDKEGNVKEEEVAREAYPSVVFKIKPTKEASKEKSPFNEFHIRYEKDFSLDIQK